VALDQFAGGHTVGLFEALPGAPKGLVDGLSGPRAGAKGPPHEIGSSGTTASPGEGGSAGASLASSSARCRSEIINLI
jgi:hypothetical protein